MEIYDRLLYLFVGGVVGFILGYLTRGPDSIREEEAVRASRHPWVERIRVKFRGLPFNKIALFIVVMMSVLASFQSQKVSNEVRDGEKIIERVVQCNTIFLDRVILALDERTTYTSEQADANIALQKAQRKLLNVSSRVEPIPSEAERQRATVIYLDALNRFIDLAAKSAEKADTHAYPSSKAYRNCADEGVMYD